MILMMNMATEVVITKADASDFENHICKNNYNFNEPNGSSSPVWFYDNENNK